MHAQDIKRDRERCRGLAFTVTREGVADKRTWYSSFHNLLVQLHFCLGLDPRTGLVCLHPKEETAVRVPVRVRVERVRGRTPNKARRACLEKPVSHQDQ